MENCIILAKTGVVKNFKLITLAELTKATVLLLLFIFYFNDTIPFTWVVLLFLAACKVIVMSTTTPNEISAEKITFFPCHGIFKGPAND